MLIRTKLHRPVPRPDLVERSALLARLGTGGAQRLTLVSAPAGSGKTTMATQWLEAGGVRSTWLSLDPLDNDYERFARYWIAALREALPGALPASFAMISSRVQPPPSSLAETMGAELAELQVDDPLVVVLDDFHALTAEPVRELVEGIVEALPGSLHLVVLTRRDPPWPLARLRARGWLRELRARDLLFSFDEVREFLSTGGAALDDDSLRLLHEKTEGWPAGLRLARAALERAADPGAWVRELTGGQRQIADFLLEEVLAVQPADVVQFLRVTAPLERFCAPLCDHMLGREPGVSAARASIAHLERENVFLVPLDDEGRWYRYHHLFRELLRQQLRERDGREASTAPSRRAAEWFAREGLVEEALQHWIAAGELDAAAGLLGEHLEAVLSQDLSRRVLRRWLGMFPPGAEHGRLPLLVAHGYLGILRWDLEGLARLLDEAEQLLERGGDPATGLRATVDAQRGFQLYWRGHPEAALARSSRALDAIAPRVGGMTWTLGTMYRAGSLGRIGRLREAQRALAQAADEDAAQGSPHAGELLTTRSALDLYAADVGSARARALQMLVVHQAAPVPDYWLAHAHYFLGSTAYEFDRLEEAKGHFRAVEPFRFLTSSRIYQDALIGRSLVALAGGDLATARAHAAAAMEYAVATSGPVSMHIAESLESRLRADGVPPRPGPPSSEEDAMSLWLEVPTLTYAQALLERPGSEAGEALLAHVERAVEVMERAHNVRLSIACSVLRAMALDRVGERAAALGQLSAVLRRAEPHRLVRTFLDRGPRLRELLAALAGREGGDGYVAELLQAFERRGIAPTMRSGAPEARTGGPARTERVVPDGLLTDRELDVLELLADRYSNKEIAKRLFVSLETVKTHLQAIYGKLGVHGRREAVSAARGRGLLPQNG